MSSSGERHLTSLPEVHVAADPEAAAQAAATEVLALVRDAVAARGRASVALAGGTTPGLLYRNIATVGRAGAPWDRVHIFFGDERCVPAASPHSNYALARRELLEPLGIPAGSVHRMEAEIRPAAVAAEAYEKRLRAHFAPSEPVFDLVLLGIGADGHTASLFPGDSALDETRRWVVAVRAPAGYEPTERITLALPVINRARAVFFLAAGGSKCAAIEAVLGAEHPVHPMPAGRVRPAGRLTWFLDRAAAGRWR